MANYVAVDTRALAQLRRDLKRAEPAVRRALDRELREMARVVAKQAASNSVHKSGRFAAAWKPSVTQGRGVAVVNRAPQARQQEFGGKVWLRRGRPYITHESGDTSRDIGSLPIRQVTLKTLPNGSRVVQNEAQYLIRRSQPGRRAVQTVERTIAPRIADACSRAIDAAL